MDEDQEIPIDDQGINTEYILEISEKTIKRVWEEVCDDKKDISFEDLHKAIKIADDSYNLAVRALEVSYNLTQDYFYDINDNNNNDDDDENDQDFY